MKKLSKSAFLKRVKDAIRHYDMLSPGDRVLVAVSGGPDSVGLLRSLSDLRKGLGIEIVVGNLDHGIRGRESKRDSKFVKDLSGKLGFVCEYRKADLGAKKKSKRSLEERAREERYAFLKNAARKNKCSVIATGHTLDDQAETVLMRVITGTSPSGLSGIYPVRQEEGIKIIRPFIRTSKRDILDYLETAGWEYVEDRTNLDKKIKRNRVRLEVLPYLEKINPRIKRSLANLADALREDFSLMGPEDEKSPSLCIKSEKESASVKIADLILQPKMLRKAVFKEAVARAGGNIKKLTYRHWADMDYFLRTSRKGKSLDFPGGVRMTRYSHELIFKKQHK